MRHAMRYFVLLLGVMAVGPQSFAQAQAKPSQLRLTACWLLPYRQTGPESLWPGVSQSLRLSAMGINRRCRVLALLAATVM